VAAHQYGNATVDDFVTLTEQRFPQLGLAHFFDVWLYQPGKPTDW
jgi:aminopeptidase N